MKAATFLLTANGETYECVGVKALMELCESKGFDTSNPAGKALKWAFNRKPIPDTWTNGTISVKAQDGPSGYPLKVPSNLLIGILVENHSP